MPYTGNIISGQNVSQFTTGKGCTVSTTISVASPTASPTTNYITSNANNLANGCVVAWKLNAN